MCDHGDGPEWGYEEHNGPAVWGRLDPAYETCSLGAEQSPIDLTGGRSSGLPRVEFDYGRTAATIENTGHGIQVNPVPGSGIVIDGIRHELRQFHFHHRSEHTVEGERLPLEMHLVHEDARGSIAVVGVLFAEGGASDALAVVWARFPADPSPPRPIPEELDLAALLPDRRTMWRYRGSLTTPPCSEGVAWAIFAEPLSVSVGQIEAFAAIYPNNYRPVQPLGERVVHLG
jgi:carbonic anhydrase